MKDSEHLWICLTINLSIFPIKVCQFTNPSLLLQSARLRGEARSKNAIKQEKWLHLQHIWDLCLGIIASNHSFYYFLISQMFASATLGEK